MSRTSTRSNKSKKSGGRAERVLLFAILAVGIIGLAVSYAGPSTTATDQSASAVDSISSDGKLKSDRMILHLNQRGKVDDEPAETTRF